MAHTAFLINSTQLEKLCGPEVDFHPCDRGDAICTFPNEESPGAN